MGRAVNLIGAAVLIVALSSTAASAEEWVLTASSATAVYETDVSTLNAKEEVIHSWMRETLAHPRKDDLTKKTYIQSVTQRSDDCQRRKFALGSVVRRNEAGQVVASTAGGSGWQDITPGSVTEGMWKNNCAIFNQPSDEPWLKSISEGKWRQLGLSADKKYYLSLKSDEVIKLQNGLVLSVVRSEYIKPEWIDGYAVKYIVSASVTDCANEKNAPAGIDLYVAPSLRVKAVRVDRAKMEFVPIAPGSFLSKDLKDLCAAATPVRAQASQSGGETGLFSGTAWGVSKGYLITSSHVIEHGKSILVYSNGERVGAAKIVLDDPVNDLAILKFLKTPPTKLKVLSISDRSASLGKSVFTLGYPEPEALGQSIKMTAGQVSSTAGYRDDARLIQISIPVQEGNSGGPVISWDGVVLGVVKSKLARFDDDDDSLPPENVNYAVKSAYIRPLLDDLPDLGNYDLAQTSADQDQWVQNARAAVFMLLVTK